jgi:hypothetical protein
MRKIPVGLLVAGVVIAAVLALQGCQGASEQASDQAVAAQTTAEQRATEEPAPHEQAAAEPVETMPGAAAAPPTTAVPVTMTMERRQDKHPADSVKFYSPDGSPLGSAVKEGPQKFQERVGYLSPTDTPPVYRLKAEVFIAKSGHLYEFSFDPNDSCTTATNTSIGRIACSVVKHGAGLVCSATYHGMDLPKAQCSSTACLYCGRIRICGSNPQCY